MLIQAIFSLKDVTKSKQQIKSELPKLEQQLQSDKSARVKIVAGLDINKSKSLIESQLGTLSSKIKVPAIKVGINTNNTHNNSYKVNTNPNQQKINEYLAKQVKLQNEIYDIQIKQSKIEESKRSSSELYSTLSKQLITHQNELSLLQSENSEMTKLISVEQQREKVAEQTTKKREAYELAIAKSKDRELSLSQSIKQQSQNSLTTEIKKGNQLERQVDTLKSQISVYQSINTKASKHYENDFNSLIQELDLAKTSDDVAKVRAKFATLRSEIKLTGQEGKTLWQTMRDGAEKFSSWMTLTTLISTAARDVKKMVTNVIELDSAMTNLKKVTDETDSTYERFLKNTSQQAKELHSTITDLIEQTSTWSKLGYNLNESNILAKASMIYSNVGEVDNEQAVTNIVSALKAFDIAAEDVMKIPDVYNKLGNEFAVSSKNLGSGMAQAATTMSMAGNNFNQVAAILTGAGEVLGDNKMEEIGNGMKTVTLRIQNQAGALKELGEEYEDLISVSKTQQQIFELTHGAVNIMQDSDPNSFRTTYDILADVAEVIKDLNDTEASELIQLLFGKNRANVGTAVLKAFQSGQIQKAYQAAQDSAGSAQAEFDKWSESIEAHLNTFSASFESLSNTVVNSDLIKGGVDFLTGCINLLDTLIDKLGVIPTLISAITLGTSIKNVGELKTNTPSYAPLSCCA